MIGLAQRNEVELLQRFHNRDNLAKAIDPATLLPGLRKAGRPMAECAIERVFARADGGFVMALHADRQPSIAEIPAGDAVAQFDDLLRRFRKERRRHHLKNPADPREFCLVPELNLIVRHAGLDEKIDGLDLLHTPDRLAKTFDGPRRARLLAHRLRRRCVIEVAGSDAPPLFLKLYKRGSSRPRHNAGLVRFLERTSFRENGTIRIPRIVQSFPELDGFAMAGAPGLPLNALQGTARLAGMALAGEALGRLHRLPLRLDVKFAADDEIDLLSRSVELAGDIFPGLRKGLNAALAHVAARLASRRRHPSCTVHRDFHERQIIVDGETCQLIDFDTACIGDPKLDVGNFLAHLDLAALQGSDDRAGPAEAFLEAYARAHHAPHRADVAAYRLATHLRLARIYAFSTQWSYLVPRLIDLTHGQSA
jgi:hypothetical protein